MQEVAATVPELLARAASLAHSGTRKLLGIVGAPGAGKTTLGTALTKALDGLAMLVPMDGFHLDNPTLEQAGRPRPRTGHRQRDSGAARGAAGVHGGQLSPA